MAMPATTYGQTLPTISRSQSEPGPYALDQRYVVGADRCVHAWHVPHPVLEIRLHAQPADHPAGNDSNRKAKAEVEGGDLPAEEPEQQRERDLVDHRRRDQERERNAKRHTRLHEPDEQRHCRARAERCNDAERGRQDIATPPRRGRRGATRVRSGVK